MSCEDRFVWMDRHGYQLDISSACSYNEGANAMCRLYCRYAMMEMGLDFPELPLGMVTETHLKRCKSFSNSLLCHPDKLWYL